MSQFGLVRALVTDNRDPEKMGRVRIRYHWFGENDAGKQQSEWAHVVRDTCHKEAGVWFLPEVGDEVVVGFEFGHHGTPLVLGSVFNKDNKPPVSGKAGDGNADGKNTLQFIKTRSGHMLVFDDTESDGSVTLRDNAGSEIVMQSKDGELRLIDKNQNKILLTNDGASIEDQNGNKITLHSGGITINSASEIKLGDGATEALIKGTSFMQFFNQHIHATPVGTSSPPNIPMIAEQHLSQKVKTT